MTTTLVQQLLEAGVHFGHQTNRWHPKMKRFIFGARAGIYIIDLEKTEVALIAACDFLQEVAARGEQILFVGTKKQAKPILEAEAQRAGMPFVTIRWLGGTLTNFENIKRNIQKLCELRQLKADGAFDRLSKKEAKRKNRKLGRLEQHFAGLVTMGRPPGCLFVVDTKREQIAVREANRLNIPIVAICDTNADPDPISHPIPGNDDAIKALKLLVGMAADRILAGRQRFMTAQEAQEAQKAKEGAQEAAAVAAQAAADTPTTNGTEGSSAGVAA